MSLVQLNPEADAQLAALDMRLVDITNRRSKAQEDYDAAFAEAFDIFKAAGRPENVTTRWVTPTGHIIERRVSSPEPKLNVIKLKAALEVTPEGKRLWNRLATPVAWEVDLQGLQKAIEAGRVSGAIVGDCIETPTPTVSRYFREAAKSDAVWLKEQNLLALLPKLGGEETAASA